jgi:hypothetical protein
MRVRTTRPGAGRNRRDESGIALVTSILLLLLVAATAISAIDFSGQELQAGGRARASMRTLYAADAGIQFALQQVQPPTDLTGFTIDINNELKVESRTRSQSGAQVIDEAGVGEPPDGYAINVGSGFVSEVYDINVTATGANGATSELEAKLSSLKPNSGAF